MGRLGGEGDEGDVINKGDAVSIGDVVTKAELAGSQSCTREGQLARANEDGWVGKSSTLRNESSINSTCPAVVVADREA